MAVSKRLRHEVFRRDNHTCRYCGSSAPDVAITIDHVIPVSLGGSDEASNLVTACKDCNAGKSSVSPDAPIVAEIDAKALIWRDAMMQAAAEREAAHLQTKGLGRKFKRLWTARMSHLQGYASRYAQLPPNFEDSITQFLNAGLTFADLDELIGAAAKPQRVNDRFAYFCGCCWTRVKQAQMRAMEIVAMPSAPADSSPVDEGRVEALHSFAAAHWLEKTGWRLPGCACNTSWDDQQWCGDWSCRELIAVFVRALRNYIEDLRPENEYRLYERYVIKFDEWRGVGEDSRTLVQSMLETSAAANG